MNSYIEITDTGTYQPYEDIWTYRLSMTQSDSRLICRKRPMPNDKKAKFVFEVDKLLATKLFDRLAQFQLKMSPPRSPCDDAVENNLTIGSSFGFIKIRWDDSGIENEALENFVYDMKDMASLLIDLQRESPDMKITPIRFCKIHYTDTSEGRFDDENPIGLRYAGGTVYALDSENREFGQFSPEDSTFILDNISIDRQLKICAGNWFGEAGDSTMDALVLEYTPRK